MNRRFVIYSSLLTALLWLGGITLGQAEVQTTSNLDYRAIYKEECASCHMAYPAELLPSRSWQNILDNLQDHFGDNASLDPATLKIIDQYLQSNSADKVASRWGRKLLRSVSPDATPVRITELPYFRHEHNEIPLRYIKDNPKVKSLSNCIACHQGAEQGQFDEHSIRIPGYGRWDD